MTRSRALSLVLLALAIAACDDGAPRGGGAPTAAEPTTAKAATRHSGPYRQNEAVPHGNVAITIRARSGGEVAKLVLPADYRARNPSDAAYCDGCIAKDELIDERIVVDAATLGVRDVAVSVRDVAEGPLPPLQPLTLDNSCCRFVPHVGFAPVGAPLSITNSDPVTHAVVITTLSGTQLSTMTIPAGGSSRTPSIDAPGILDVTCPIHSWMQGFVVATRHPYVAVTDATGVARIPRVPEGAHQVVLWHKSLGRAKVPIVVAAGVESQLSIDDSAFEK